MTIVHHPGAFQVNPSAHILPGGLSTCACAMQIVTQEGAAGLERLRAEYVVRIQGQLRKRIDPNPNIPTGMVELVAEQVRTCPRL